MTSASPAAFVVMSAILDSVSDDPATERGARRRAAARRRRRVIAAGHTGQVELARAGLRDPDPDVQAAALGALARLSSLTVADITHLPGHRACPVRRRATDAALSVRGPGSRSTLYTRWLRHLATPIPWSSWERPGSFRSVGGRGRHRAGHDRPAPTRTCVPEASVAALGAIGDPRGLTAVIDALDDKPTVRPPSHGRVGRIRRSPGRAGASPIGRGQGLAGFAKPPASCCVRTDRRTRRASPRARRLSRRQ